MCKGRNIQEFSVGDTSVGDGLTLHHAIHAQRGPGSGHIGQRHNIQGTLCSRGATSKNFRSGTHRSGTHQPCFIETTKHGVCDSTGFRCTGTSNFQNVFATFSWKTSHKFSRSLCTMSRSPNKGLGVPNKITKKVGCHETGST